MKFNDFAEVGKRPFSSFRRKPESRRSNHFWTPAFAGVTALATFFERINFHWFDSFLRHSLFIIRPARYARKRISYTSAMPTRVTAAFAWQRSSQGRRVFCGSPLNIRPSMTELFACDSTKPESQTMSACRSRRPGPGRRFDRKRRRHRILCTGPG
jgi:hypothetical protein